MSFLEKELLEQGEVIANRATPGGVAAASAAELIGRADVEYILIAARGSSDNAARFAQYAFGRQAGRTVALAAPSLFSDPERSPDLRGAAVLAISQSGQSPDIVSVVEAGRAQGRPTVALTNDGKSALAAKADVVVPLYAGPERSVAATKTYLASLHAVEQIIDQLSPDAARAHWLTLLPKLVDNAVRSQFARRAEFDVLNGVEVLTAVGRGLGYSAAYESALKIRELSGMVTESYSPADLLHGPVAAVGATGGLWIVDVEDEPDGTLDALLDRLRSKRLPTVIVSDRARDAGPTSLQMPVAGEAPTWVRAILAVIPGQVAAFQLASERGVEVDRPHGLSKVTLTR